MRIPRIFFPSELGPQAKLLLEGNPARHLTQVLRLGPGAEAVLFNGNGREYRTRILRVDQAGALVEVESVSEPAAEPPLQIHLGIGISKGERMDWVMQKSVELGVAALTPLRTERTVVKLTGSRLERRIRHWQGVVIAACEQSGRRSLPTLRPEAALSEWLNAQAGGRRLMLDHRADSSLREMPPPTDPQVLLLVGPEGGLSAQERALAASHGFQGVRLGPRILRTETAPLAALTAIQLLWGDLG